MKSDVIVINGSESGTEAALELTEKFYEGSSPKTIMRMSLLAEETMNLVRAITQDADMEAEFSLEKEADVYRIQLNTNTIMYADKRKALMEISSKKENAAAKGVLGKIREVFELALLPKDERSARESRIGMMGLTDPTAIQTMSATWKMSNYISSVNESATDAEFAQEAKNELEKSILANLAKDVIIGIVGDDVKLTIEYTPEK
jgi:hypothetical protein